MPAKDDAGNFIADQEKSDEVHEQSRLLG